MSLNDAQYRQFRQAIHISSADLFSHHSGQLKNFGLKASKFSSMPSFIQNTLYSIFKHSSNARVGKSFEVCATCGEVLL